MSGLKLFELGNLNITTGGSSANIGGMTSIGVSIITGENNDSLTLKAGTSIYFDTNKEHRFITNETERMRITAGGNVGIGTDNPSQKLWVNGVTQTVVLKIKEDSATGWVIYDDVNGLSFYNGSSGNTWRARINNSLNVGDLDFTGQHKNLMNSNIDISKLGLIVSTTNNYINLDNSIVPKINESLPYCVITNTDNDKKVFGVISSKEDNENSREYATGRFISVYEKENINEERMYINSVGEGAVWVANKNGSLETGDYITSTSIPGYGGKQILNEEFLVRFTVAKITCDCDFSLTKIAKQKLKTVQTSAGQELVYDSQGNPEYENDLDPDGNIQMVYQYQTRFLQADGTLLVDQTDYETRLNNGESVYIACFVGCTYHCG